MGNDHFLPIQFQNPLNRAAAIARSERNFMRNPKAELPKATSWTEIEVDVGPTVPNQLPAPNFIGSRKVDVKSYDSKTDWAPTEILQHEYEYDGSWNVPSEIDIRSKQWEELGRKKNAELLKDLENDPERKALLKQVEDGEFFPKTRLIDESKKQNA